MDVNEISFSYERLGNKTRPQKEAEGRSGWPIVLACGYIHRKNVGKLFLLMKIRLKVLFNLENTDAVPRPLASYKNSSYTPVAPEI